jgi:hypothetical protein
MSHEKTGSKPRTGEMTVKQVIIREQLTSLKLVIGAHLSDLMRENGSSTSITQTDNDDN